MGAEYSSRRIFSTPLPVARILEAGCSSGIRIECLFFWRVAFSWADVGALESSMRGLAAGSE